MKKNEKVLSTMRMSIAHSLQQTQNRRKFKLCILKYLPAKNNDMLKNRLLFSRKIS